MPEPKLPIAVTCECAISYHVVETRDGRRIYAWDEEPPGLMQMCFGRCTRCGLPYHTEFTRDEIV